MSALASAAWWVDTGERAVRAFAQATLAASGVGVAAGSLAPGVSVPWVAALACGGINAALSVLGSLASLQIPGCVPPPPPSVLRMMWRRR